MDPIILHANTYRFAPGEVVHHRGVCSRMQVWCLEGRGALVVDGRREALTPGVVLLLPWGFEIRYLAERRRPFHLAGIHLVPTAAALDPMPFSRVPHDGRAVSGLADDGDPVCRGFHRLDWTAATAWRELSSYIVRAFTRAAPQVAEQRRLARQLVAEWRWVLERAPGEDPAWRAIAGFVAAHPALTPSLVQLARIAGCSTATLSRRVRGRFGCSPTIWLQRLKVELAKDRLVSPDRPLAAIAEELGFCDAFYLSRVFKRHTGLSPREWRRRGRLL